MPRISENFRGVRSYDERKRVGFLGEFELFQGFIGAALSCEPKRIPLMGRRVVRIQFEGALEFRLGARPVPVVVHSHKGERGMSFGESLIEL